MCYLTTLPTVLQQHLVFALSAVITRPSRREKFMFSLVKERWRVLRGFKLEMLLDVAAFFLVFAEEGAGGRGRLVT